MPLYLDECPVAICDRCSMKAAWKDLIPDGNSPGLRVHRNEDCWDPKNPWRLPPIKPDRISLRWSRPDVPLSAGKIYPDITTDVNPQPPTDTFVSFVGLEGSGIEGLEGSGKSALEPGP